MDSALPTAVGKPVLSLCPDQLNLDFIHSSYDKFSSISDSHHLTLTGNFTRDQTVPSSSTPSFYHITTVHSVIHSQRDKVEKSTGKRSWERKCRSNTSKPKKTLQKKADRETENKNKLQRLCWNDPIFPSSLIRVSQLLAGTKMSWAAELNWSWNREDISHCKRGFLKQTNKEGEKKK